MGTTSATIVAVSAASVGLYYLYTRRRPQGSPQLTAALAEITAAGKEDPACLDQLATMVDLPLDSAAFAAALDDAHPLSHRNAFHVPAHDAGNEQAYMAGNSLGLMPKRLAGEVGAEMDKWAARGVMGHFEGALPWATCEEALPPLLADLVGAKDPALEIGAMNSLTVNLHLLMAAFYRPSEGRAAILIEAGAFPSDRYAVGSQIRHHGRSPDEWLIEVQPRKEDSLLHTVSRATPRMRIPPVHACLPHVRTPRRGHGDRDLAALRCICPSRAWACGHRRTSSPRSRPTSIGSLSSCSAASITSPAR